MKQRFIARKLVMLSALSVIVPIFIYYVHRLNCPDQPLPVWFPDSRSWNFVQTLSRRASSDRFVILAMVDAAFTDMAINLYETSFRPNGIKNFLFAGTGSRACEILASHSLPCFHYADDKDAEVSSVYKGQDFIRKMNIRTEMILDALDAGFTVLHTDLDVVFLRNPVPELTRAELSTADVATLWDNSEFNAGFVLIRPTEFSKMVYERTKAITLLNEKMDDQRALNAAIRHIKKIHEKQGFNAVALDQSRYLCGLDYYEKGNRSFASECPNCTVVHNNWIVSREAKIYRFKEHLMWQNNEDEYYTSHTRRYIVYDNPVEWDDEEKSVAEELEALKAALAYGRLLDRIVILPRFHCVNAFSKGKTKKNKATINSSLRPNRECPLNSLLKISAFDTVFAKRYRESSFLSHPKVPESVKRDQSVPYFIQDERSDAAKIKTGLRDGRLQVLSVSLDLAASVKLLLAKLNLSVKVLRFESLYHSMPSFPNATDQEEFKKTIKAAFERALYRQF